MQTNALPKYDMSDNTTGCCPRFNTDGWDHAELQFRDKAFVKATSRAILHIPLNIGSVFTRVQNNIEDAGAFDENDYIVLSRDISGSKSEHYFSVTKPVPGEEMTTLNGNFFTRVFQGPYREVRNWCRELQAETEARGSQPSRMFFFYTTCPKCAKAYGENYTVGVAEV